MIWQHDYPTRLRKDCAARAVSLMEAADWLSLLAESLPDQEAHKLKEVAAYTLDCAGLLHVLGTDKAKAGALLQGHVLSPVEPEGGAA